METTIKQYIRRTRGEGPRKHTRKTGILVAMKIGEEVRIGWSMCHSQKDKFDLKWGMMIATRRAKKPHGFVMDWTSDVHDTADRQRRIPILNIMGECKIPNSIQDDVQDFITRAKKYFKDTDVVL